jgi:hypothetical protein
MAGVRHPALVGFVDHGIAAGDSPWAGRAFLVRNLCTAAAWRRGFVRVLRTELKLRPGRWGSCQDCGICMRAG